MFHNEALALYNRSKSLYKCFLWWLLNDLLIDSVHSLDSTLSLAPALMNMSFLSERRLLAKLSRPTIIGAKMLFSCLFLSTVARGNEPIPA